MSNFQKLVNTLQDNGCILKQAFAGRLVPQVISDEPAFELLKRIQAERGQ